MEVSGDVVMSFVLFRSAADAKLGYEAAFVKYLGDVVGTLLYDLGI